MSYCRKGPDSDVYVYNTKDYDKDRRRVVERFICFECALGGDIALESIKEMVSHLFTHRLMGHVVPDQAITSLLDR